MGYRKNNSNLLWMEITDLESAVKASKVGFWASAIVGVFLAVTTTVALSSSVSFDPENLYAYIDCVLFLIAAWRIKRYSKFFSCAAPVLYILGKIIQYSDLGSLGILNLPISVIFLLLFITGARGVFAYHKYSDERVGTENL